MRDCVWSLDIPDKSANYFDIPAWNYSCQKLQASFIH